MGIESPQRKHRVVKFYDLESLEPRRTPARFGFPWLDPEHLTISFAPDGTPVGSQSSVLFQTLDQSSDRATWQREILRAFQTWAVQSNINIGLAPDNGLSLGSLGKTQGDSRFGDIRVTSVPLSPNVFMAAMPPDPIFAGTLSGDVMINSLYQFVNDPSADHDPEESQTLRFENLYRGVLHEAGHALGLAESDSPTSIMYRCLGDASVLSQEDIKAIQGLYGTRAADRYEGENGNNTRDKATPLPSQISLIPGLQAIEGDIQSNSDMDFYLYKSPKYYTGAMLFQVRTEGRSLLMPKITVYDEKGKVVGQGQSLKVGGDNVSVRLPSILADKTYYVSVEGASQDEFGIGGYVLGIAPEKSLTSISSTLYNGIVSFMNSSGANIPIYSFEMTPNETSITAKTLQTAIDKRMVLRGTQLTGEAKYNALGQLASATDIDVFEVAAPKPADSTRPIQALIAHITGYGVNSAPPKIEVLDANGKLVASEVLVSEKEGYMIQVRNPVPGAKYLIRVQTPDHPLGTVKFYKLDVLFSESMCDPETYLSGSIAPGETQTRKLFVAETQIFHLLLQTGGLAGLEMQVIDSAGKIVLQITGNGDPISAETPYLDPGEYTIKLISSNVTKTIVYALTGMSLSDSVNPGLTSPVRAPIYNDSADSNLYLYPNGALSLASSLWL